MIPRAVLTGSLISGVLAASGCASSLVALTFFQPSGQIAPVVLPPRATEYRIATGDDGAATVQLFHVAQPGASRCVVFLHGTGGYAAQRLPFAVAMAAAGDCDVVLAEYRGYGDSPGEPSEASVYADARAALRWTGEALGYPPERVVVIARSLGTAVACEVVTDAPYAGLVLMTPFTSGRAMAGAFGFSAFDFTIGNPFDSASKLPHYAGPLLLIHGTDDQIVPFPQGQALFDLANEPKEFVQVEAGVHNRLFTDAHGRATIAGYDLLAAFVQRCVPPAQGK